MTNHETAIKKTWNKKDCHAIRSRRLSLN